MTHNSNFERPSWDEYFMVGAVIVKDKRVLSTGYNGSPAGLAHCLDIGCLREKMGIPSGERHELCRAIHAEQNAIIQAATSGTSIQGATLYCTTSPCVLCVKVLINSGITEIYAGEGYPDDLARQMLEEANVKVHRLVVSESPEMLTDFEK